MADALFTAAEAIAYLKLDRQGLKQPRESLRWLRRTGKLKFARVGRSILFRRSWLDAVIDAGAVQRNSCNRHIPAPKARRK
jgi:hypothetical protein